MNEIQVQRVLKQLYRISEAGEKGYATAAVNMPSSGIKVMLKAFAQQRANYKEEILAAMRRYGGDSQPGTSIPGIIHRGRVAIFAGMSIERERQVRVILKEALVGERVALREYEKALREDLPGEVREMVQWQLGEMKQVVDQVENLSGRAGKRVSVGLFETQNSAEQAIQQLRSAGIDTSTVEITDLDATHEYQGAGATVMETAASGAFGGALWGGLTGILVGYGVVQSTQAAGTPIGQMFGTWLLAALGFMAVGALIGVVLAIFIGSSISEGDKFHYNKILQHGDLLLRVETDEARAAEATKILAGFARAAPPAAAKRAA